VAQSLRQIKNRIRTVENIKKITRAMEMVAVAKLRSLEKELFLSKEYHLHVEKMLGNILVSFPHLSHNLLQEVRENKNIALCVITSDTGLCGAYNSALLRAAEDFISENKEKNISLIIIGKKGFIYFKRKGYVIIDNHLDLYGRYSEVFSKKIVRSLIEMFLTRKVDTVYAAYTKFVTSARHAPVIEKILNLEVKGGLRQEYLTEPQVDKILENLLPLYLESKIKDIILNAFTAENATRVVSMSEATHNAKELLDDLIIVRNKARQADITREIIEVISSSDAMKG